MGSRGARKEEYEYVVDAHAYAYARVRRNDKCKRQLENVERVRNHGGGEQRESERVCMCINKKNPPYRLPAFLLGLLDFFFPDPAASSVVPAPEDGMYPHSSNNRRAALLICLNLSALNGIPPYHLLFEEQKQREILCETCRKEEMGEVHRRCKGNVEEKRGRDDKWFYYFGAAFLFVVLLNADVDVDIVCVLSMCLCVPFVLH